MIGIRSLRIIKDSSIDIFEGRRKIITQDVLDVTGVTRIIAGDSF